jgi:hypothetical protein
MPTDAAPDADATLAREALRLAEKGTDFRTIQVHFECKLERDLTPGEGAVLLEAWRLSYPARKALAERADAKAASEARGLRPRR